MSQLNNLSHNPVVAPECTTLEEDDFVAPGGTYEEKIDANGTLLFQCVRLKDPKDFRQRRPDRNEKRGWAWNLKGVRLVPFQLFAPDATIDIVELEHRRLRLGLYV